MKEVAAGAYHSCGVTYGNKIYCWGNAGSGQLGIGSFLSGSPQYPTPLPVDMSGVLAGKVITALSAGDDHTLAFRKVRGPARFEDAELDFTIPTGAIVMASTSQHGLQRLFTNLLKLYQLPVSGYVTLGGTDLKDIEAHHLRMTIYVLDRPSFVPMTIRQYLSLSCATGESWRMLDALEAVGLTETIAGLDKGLDTAVAATGYPLSTVELLKLKLASAILARPRVLILTRLFDLIEADDLARTLAAVREQGFTTVIYFSNRDTALGCDRFLHIGARSQRWFDNFAAFAAARRDSRAVAADPDRLRNQIGEPPAGGERR